jgi:hypothetical protein
MRTLAAVGLVLLAACNSSPSSGVAAHSPAPSRSYLLPPISPAPVASAGDCYLPIYWYAGDVPSTVHTGFFHYPNGEVQGETSVRVRSANDTFVADAATYDRAVNRWLPATPSAISPDGLHFAYADYDLVALTSAGGKVAPMAGALATTGRVHIVDARTGADHIIFNGSPTYRVVGYTAAGVYLAAVLLTMDGMFASGLLLIAPGGGVPQRVAGGSRPMDRSGWQVEGAYAWGSDFSGGGSITGGNRVLSLDLNTGAVQVWNTWPEGVATEVIGLDPQGLPIVGVYLAYSTAPGSSPALPGLQVWMLSAPGTGKVVFQTTGARATLPTGPAFADSHGAWIGASPPSSVWLLTPAAGLSRVPVPVTGLGWVGVGGQCM